MDIISLKYLQNLSSAELEFYNSGYNNNVFYYFTYTLLAIKFNYVN